jgi:hypothetical protein
MAAGPCVICESGTRVCGQLFPKHYQGVIWRSVNYFTHKGATDGVVEDLLRAVPVVGVLDTVGVGSERFPESDSLDAHATSAAAQEPECRAIGGSADARPVCPRPYVLPLKRRLTLDVTARVTRIGREEPQTRRASRGPS